MSLSYFICAVPLAQLLWTTLVYEFLISCGHTEWYFLFLLSDSNAEFENECFYTDPTKLVFFQARMCLWKVK